MNKCEEIAAAYRAVTVKGAWYGPTIAEMLAEITPAMATAKPVGATHTIAELLQHLLLWNERIRNTSESCPMAKWEAEKEWAEAPIPWDELVERWNKSRALLEERMGNFPEEDLGKQTPGRTYPYEYMLNGIVQHTIWHGGQIAMLRSMAKGRA